MDSNQDNSRPLDPSGAEAASAPQNAVPISKRVQTLKSDLAAIQQQAKIKIETSAPKPLSNVTGIPRVTPVPGLQYDPNVPKPLSAWQNKESGTNQDTDGIASKSVFGPSRESFAEPREKREKISAGEAPEDPSLAVNPFDDQEKRPQTPLKPIISPIETFSGDVADSVNKQHTSLATIAIAENDRRAKRVSLDNTEEKGLTAAGKNVLIIAISLIFLGLGVGAVYYFIALHSLSSQKAPLAPQSKDIIQSEVQTTLSLEGLNHNQFIQALQTLIAGANIEEGQIEHVNMVYASTTAITQDLFALLQTDAPSALIRSFNDSFYFGINKTNGGNEPFLILTTSSYSETEGGMLEWEPTVVADMQDVFLKTPNRITAGTEYSFQDALIDNKEVRLIKNAQGEIIFLYSLIDQSTLIIATNQFTFEELLDRLNSANFVR